MDPGLDELRGKMRPREALLVLRNEMGEARYLAEW